MNIKNKKTALGDDSILYQKKHDTVDKDYMKNMSFKAKLQYFADYYLKYVIVAIVILVIVGNLLNAAIFNRSEDILTVNFLNECMITEDETLHQDLKEYLQPLKKNDDVIISGYTMQDYQMSMVFQTRLAVQQLDFLICPQQQFEEMAAQGTLYDMTELLPADVYEKYQDKIMMASQATEMDDEGKPLGYKDPQPFGLDLSGNEVLKKYGMTEEHAVLCVAVNTNHLERVLQALDFIIG